MKKVLALLLALAMVLCLAACGGKTNNEETTAAEGAEETEVAGGEEAANDADAIADNMTSEDGKYEVAFVTDIGQLKDKSFNQGTYDGVKLYANANGLSYKYYQPANGENATDDDRYDAMAQACDNGAKVVVCAGFLQETALKKAAIAYPEVKFVFIDGYPLSDENGEVLANVAGIAFNEEQCGYFAGYAVVKEGFTKLGFCGGGGGTNPACCRYGYGFVQGANAAAAEMDAQVEMNYSWLYGSNYSASTELQTLAEGWYTNGTEVIFACGGSMFNSITAAASANDAFVVGVDSDQSFDSDTVITSALKGVGEAAAWAIAKVYDNTWEEIGGTATSLGAKDNSTGLPTATWSMTKYTVEEYEAQLAAVVDGTITIDADYEANFNQEYSNLTLNIVE